MNFSLQYVKLYQKCEISHSFFPRLTEVDKIHFLLREKITFKKIVANLVSIALRASRQPYSHSEQCREKLIHKLVFDNFNDLVE